MVEDIDSGGLHKSRKKKRRRNKKDVVLDFRKTGKKRDNGQADVLPAKEFFRNESNKKKNSKGKLTLKTSSKDYDGTLGLPETVIQREFETTGQFLRRIDRLIARARIDANLESRFDMTLPHHRRAKKADK